MYKRQILVNLFADFTDFLEENLILIDVCVNGDIAFLLNMYLREKENLAPSKQMQVKLKNIKEISRRTILLINNKEEKELKA